MKSGSDDITPVGVGRQIGQIKATPRKRSLRDAASKLTPVQAIIEIVDNAIDNYAVQRKLGYDGGKLEIRVTLDEGHVHIQENSGGVSPDDLQAFVQVGASGEHDDVATIGVWGTGQKQAMAALGYDVTISTRYWRPADRYEFDANENTDQVLLRMDEAWWWDEENWAVDVHLPDRELPVGVTTYEIGALQRQDLVSHVEEFETELLDIYGDLLVLSNETSIVLNGNVLSEMLQDVERKGNTRFSAPRLTPEAIREAFSSPPGYEPSRQTFQLVAKGEGKDAADLKLRMDVYVGLMPEINKTAAGVYMWGVPATKSGAMLGPRLFESNYQGEAVGYNMPGTRLRRNDPTQGRLRIYLVFYGDSRWIPWGVPGSPVKREYNEANPFAKQIRDAVVDAARPYVIYTTKATRAELVRFSALWNRMNEDQRMRLMASGAGVKDPLDLLEDPEAKAKVKAEVKKGFDDFKVREWDRSKDKTPPENIPAFSEKLSKDVTTKVTDRVNVIRDMKKKGDDDPALLARTFMDSFTDLYETQPLEGYVEHVDTEEELEKTSVVSLRLTTGMLRKLRHLTAQSSNGEAVKAAVLAYYESEKGE